MNTPTTEYVSSRTEQQLLVASLQTTNPKIRALILTNTVPEDFGSPYGVEVRARIDTLLRNGKEPGKVLDFALDPALSEGAKQFILVTPRHRERAAGYDEKRVQDLLSVLKTYRNKRIFSEAAASVGEIVSRPVDEVAMERMATIFETTLTTARKDLEQQPMAHLGKGQSDVDAKAILDRLLEYTPANFITTGIATLDDGFGGYERGNLVTLSAPSGGGKSTMAMVKGINQYLKGKKNVLYVSMEMTERELWRRIASNISGIEHDVIRMAKGDINPESRAAINKAWQEFHQHGVDNNCRFTVWDVKDSRFTPQKLESYVAPMYYDVIIVDYVTLFYAGRLEKWEMQLEYSRYLKSLAKRLGCVIILLTQLSDDEKIKYGRGILENTDYWIHWKWREDEEQKTGDVDLRLEKARHARSGMFETKFDLAHMRITNRGNSSGYVQSGTSDETSAARAEAQSWGSVFNG